MPWPLLYSVKKLKRLWEKFTWHLGRLIRLDSGQADKCRSANIFPKLWSQLAATRNRSHDLRTAFLNSDLCCSGLPVVQVDLLQATTGWKATRTRQSWAHTASRHAMIFRLDGHSRHLKCPICTTHSLRKMCIS